MFRPFVAMSAALMLTACAPQGSLGVAEIGSYHVGGRQAVLSGMPTREIVFTPGAPPFKVDPNGEFEVEQMYAQFVKLAEPKARVPMVMWHGGGLSGVTWETKPDGGAGWQMYFLRQGWDVTVTDAVERGRASWARYPEIFTTEPFFRAKKEAWELFRIGSVGSWKGSVAASEALPGAQFPTAGFDQFMKQGIPRWATNDAATQRAYDAFVQKACPCVIVVHSQGGNFAFTAALNAPDKIKAIVAVEPSGAPNPANVEAAKLAALKGVPHLFVWGDNLDAHPLWRQIVPNMARWRDAVAGAGADVSWVSLPDRGLKGNSHMLMMDRNSDAVAALVQEWLTSKGLMK